MIINADDFGRTQPVTEAILDCFHRGWCSSATLMTTTPGFEHACEMTHQHRLLDHVGVHLVLDAGMPLTDDIRRFPAYCDKDGQWIPLPKASRRRLFFISRSEREALAKELAAQITRARDAGLPVTHLDSHHHAHSEWSTLGTVLDVAESMKVPCVRLTRNCNVRSRLRSLYKGLANGRIHSRKLARTQYFAILEDCLFMIRSAPAKALPESLEVMVHPEYEGDALVDKGSKNLMSAVESLPGWRHAQSFAGACFGDASGARTVSSGGLS